MLGAGTAGFIGGGPVGAVLGIAAGAAADDIYPTATGIPHGPVAETSILINNSAQHGSKFK